eukprot:TRINITY_DN57855_c0_g1_i1.p1 TRINITY_DN57855_c0_g1~~TRINITY_DN57855_c0_g1_i1.p1  ORF type:complete len:397 (+),score=66.20 TRINITY_DN57855_c0_g1_i1:157-1191(+)
MDVVRGVGIESGGDSFSACGGLGVSRRERGLGVAGVGGCSRRGGKGGLRRAHKKAVGELALGIDTSLPAKAVGGTESATVYAQSSQQGGYAAFASPGASQTLHSGRLPHTHPHFGTSEVTPWILLGARDDMHDVDQLRRLGVTHVMSIRGEHETSSHCPPAPLRQQFICYQVVVNDTCDANIEAYFERAFAFIDKALDAKGKVLVQCQKGISRSATLVIAYLMQYHKWPFEKAFDFVKERRSIINPNLGFVLTLEKFGRLNNYGGVAGSIESTIVCGGPPPGEATPTAAQQQQPASTATPVSTPPEQAASDCPTPTDSRQSAERPPFPEVEANRESPPDKPSET